jgi:hypothetical protein
MMEGMNSTMICCKNFCKCHNVPPVQQQYDNKKNLQIKKANYKQKTTEKILAFKDSDSIIIA